MTTPNSEQKIVYTLTDEAPMLATGSLLPIVRSFTAAAGIKVETTDISVAARILAGFADRLTDEQKKEATDTLAELGELTKDPSCNLIKLPNISASIPQLKAAIAELQSQGYDLPEYPDEATTEEEKDIQARYSKVLGSAVNPVLRQGNSDRRAPAAVKAFARKFPHSMGKWSPDSRTHVATMKRGDFRHNEKSLTLSKPTQVDRVFESSRGKKTVLKSGLNLQKG